MKKRFLIAGSLAFLSWVLNGRPRTDSIPQKVDRTQIELVYNHYIQDGEHSAITGGKGTEALQVYGPGLSINRVINNRSISLQLGSDIISSASTDNIDNIVSSASVLDARAYINTGFSRTSQSKQKSISAGGGVSIESDYFSLNAYVKGQYKSKDQRSNYSLNFQFFDDDLRWGRITVGVYKPSELVYPNELRGRQELDVYKRYSFNLNLAYSYMLNKRAVLGLFSSVIYQQGLLSTPFHRVYFSNGEVGLERLPNDRLKFSVAGKLNRFVRESWVLKNTIQTYVDDFGIKAINIENETIYKLNYSISIVGKLRWHVQGASKYFKPNQMHDILSQYHTSDYDLSDLQSMQFGIGFKYYPFWKMSKSFFSDEIQLHYAYYRRSDRLEAHSLSVLFLFRKERDYKNSTLPLSRL